MRERSGAALVAVVQRSPPAQRAAPASPPAPGTPSGVRQHRAFAPSFAWGFPAARRVLLLWGRSRAGRCLQPGAGALFVCWPGHGAALAQHGAQHAVAGGLRHCHPQPKSWSPCCATTGEPGPAPACLSTFTQLCAGVMHLLQNSFWSGGTRDTIFSVWDLRSVCQTVSVKTLPVLTSSQAHTPDSQLTSRKGAKKGLHVCFPLWDNYPFSQETDFLSQPST